MLPEKPSAPRNIVRNSGFEEIATQRAKNVPNPTESRIDLRAPKRVIRKPAESEPIPKRKLWTKPISPIAVREMPKCVAITIFVAVKAVI